MTEAHRNNKNMEIIILTGMSGSGKSKAADFLEDMGFFCVDNLPPQLLLELVKTFTEGQGGEGFGIKRLAFVIDVRSAEFFSGMVKTLADLDHRGLPYRIIYLDCRDDVLISRYKQSRRNHPLAGERGIAGGLELERKRLSPMRTLADVVIDTSDLQITDLRETLYKLLNEEDGGVENRMSILIQSFGFKYGMPTDSDIVMDVRFIPNPYYIDELRAMSGQDESVSEYVLKQQETEAYIQKQVDLLTFTLPYYVREGKVRLNIGVGFTGGRHRSVAIAEDLARRLRQGQYHVLVSHRDIALDLPQQGADEFGPES